MGEGGTAKDGAVTSATAKKDAEKKAGAGAGDVADVWWAGVRPSKLMSTIYTIPRKAVGTVTAGAVKMPRALTARASPRRLLARGR